MTSRNGCCWTAGQPPKQNGLKLSTAVDLISPSPAPADGPSRRQARKQKRRAAERRAQQEQRLEAAGSLLTAPSSQPSNSDAARSSEVQAAGQSNGPSTLGGGPFASLPALIAGFMTQQGFDAPTEIQSRCGGDSLPMPGVGEPIFNLFRSITSFVSDSIQHVHSVLSMAINSVARLASPRTKECSARPERMVISAIILLQLRRGRAFSS